MRLKITFVWSLVLVGLVALSSCSKETLVQNSVSSSQAEDFIIESGQQPEVVHFISAPVAFDPIALVNGQEAIPVGGFSWADLGGFEAEDVSIYLCQDPPPPVCGTSGQCPSDSLEEVPIGDIQLTMINDWGDAIPLGTVQPTGNTDCETVHFMIDDALLEDGLAGSSSYRIGLAVEVKSVPQRQLSLHLNTKIAAHFQQERDAPVANSSATSTF